MTDKKSFPRARVKTDDNSKKCPRTLFLWTRKIRFAREQIARKSIKKPHICTCEAYVLPPP